MIILVWLQDIDSSLILHCKHFIMNQIFVCLIWHLHRYVGPRPTYYVLITCLVIIWLKEGDYLHNCKECGKQGSQRSPKVLNVLEFQFSIRVPSNVLEFHQMFLNVLDNVTIKTTISLLFISQILRVNFAEVGSNTVCDMKQRILSLQVDFSYVGKFTF